MNDFPVFLDAVRASATGKLVELGSGQTESEALIPLLNQIRDNITPKAVFPEHAIYINTGAVLADPDLLQYLILTSPLASALFQLGRQHEVARRRQDLGRRRA